LLLRLGLFRAGIAGFDPATPAFRKKIDARVKPASAERC